MDDANYVCKTNVSQGTCGIRENPGVIKNRQSRGTYKQRHIKRFNYTFLMRQWTQNTERRNKNENTDPTKKTKRVAMGKHFLFLIRDRPCYYL